MIKVGINEKVQLSKAEFNDKGTLVISFVQEGQPQGNAVDDLLNDVAGVTDSNETNIMLFAPSVTYLEQPRDVKDIAIDLGALRDQLQHLLQGYMTSEKAQLDPYFGIDTSDVAAFQKSLTNQNTIDKIYKNLATQFIGKVNEIKDRLTVESFRLLLVRRSKASHYGTFRKRFISKNPFWESMKIPSESSQLEFNAYEIKNGFNSGEPVAKDPVETTPATAVGSDAAADILGSR